LSSFTNHHFRQSAQNRFRLAKRTKQCGGNI
jgi:hypothetical protein